MKDYSQAARSRYWMPAVTASFKCSALAAVGLDAVACMVVRPQPRENPLPFFAALTAALLVLCIRLVIGEEAALASLPLVLLSVALVFKRYPGEELIERLARRFRRRRRRLVSDAVPRRHATSLASRLLISLGTVRPLRGPPLLSSHSI